MKKLCVMPGCMRIEHCRGFCFNHYHSWRRGTIQHPVFGEWSNITKNSTGIPGIYFYEKERRYVVQITVEKESRYIGSYQTVPLAIKAKAEAELKYWEKNYKEKP